MKISLKGVFQALLWTIGTLAFLLLIAGFLLSIYAERKLSIERIPKAQWVNYVDKYAPTYRIMSIVKVGKYKSTTIDFRNQEAPFNNLDIIAISMNVTDADALMLAPKDQEIRMQKTTFIYKGHQYPARIFTWTSKSLSEQNATLIIAAVNLQNKRYYLKGFRTGGTGTYEKEFIRFLDGLVLK